MCRRTTKRSWRIPTPVRIEAKLGFEPDPLVQEVVLQDLNWRVRSVVNARRVRFARRSEDRQRDGFF
jgi:hypothetical protein